MVRAQGGDAAAVETPGKLPRAPHVLDVKADRSGVLSAVRTFALGELIVHLGGGRVAKEDDVDPRVGVRVLRRIGDAIASGDTLVEVHAAGDDPGLAARARACFVIEGRAAEPPALILERID